MTKAYFIRELIKDYNEKVYRHRAGLCTCEFGENRCNVNDYIKLYGRVLMH